MNKNDEILASAKFLTIERFKSGSSFYVWHQDKIVGFLMRPQFSTAEEVTEAAKAVPKEETL